MLQSIDSQIYQRAGFSVECANYLSEGVSMIRRMNEKRRAEGKPTLFDLLREKRNKQV